MPQRPRSSQEERSAVDTSGAATNRSDVYDGAGQRAGDAVEGLHPGHDELPELVDVARLGASDHVVGPGDVLGQGHTLELSNRGRYLGGLSDVGLDQDVGLNDHAELLGSCRDIPGMSGTSSILAQPTVSCAPAEQGPGIRTSFGIRIG